MNEHKGRQIIAAISGTILLWLLIGRRRAAVLGTLPNIVEDRIVLPMGDWMASQIAVAALDSAVARRAGEVAGWCCTATEDQFTSWASSSARRSQVCCPRWAASATPITTPSN